MASPALFVQAFLTILNAGILLCRLYDEGDLGSHRVGVYAFDRSLLDGTFKTLPLSPGAKNPAVF